VAPVHFAGLSARCWRACPASRHAVLSCERASKHASTAGWCRWTRSSALPSASTTLLFLHLLSYHTDHTISLQPNIDNHYTRTGQDTHYHYFVLYALAGYAFHSHSMIASEYCGAGHFGCDQRVGAPRGRAATRRDPCDPELEPAGHQHWLQRSTWLLGSTAGTVPRRGPSRSVTCVSMGSARRTVSEPFLSLPSPPSLSPCMPVHVHVSVRLRHPHPARTDYA
jgi:hypothetical protein